MRIVLPALLILAAPALPAAAQDAAQRPTPLETYRTRTVVVYGNDPCPTATSPDEIVVCARRPEEERYRLPPQAGPQPGDRVERGGADRLNGALDLDLAGGTGSCTPVGPGGATGCFEKEVQANRAQAERNRAVANPQTPANVRAPQ